MGIRLRLGIASAANPDVEGGGVHVGLDRGVVGPILMGEPRGVLGFVSCYSTFTNVWRSS